MSTDINDKQSAQTRKVKSPYSAGSSTLAKGPAKQAKIERDEELQAASSDNHDEISPDTRINWDHYAQCRLRDFEQR